MITGQELIKNLLATIPQLPGVYKMYDIAKRVIYIGKAKNLKNRLISYTLYNLSDKTQALVSIVSNIEFTITPSETDALILEAQLIKKLKPKFNVLLKDDKSFPHIKISTQHDFPGIAKIYGKTESDGKTFGPFLSHHQTNTTINLLQKIFKIRSCTDQYFATRKRACLEYGIGRCSAPCVGKISHQEYADSVLQVMDFLYGKTHKLQQLLAKQMETLSSAMLFEQAAIVRDKIKALSYTQLQATSYVPSKNVDIFAIHSKSQCVCIQAFSYRMGQFYGNKAFTIDQAVLNESNEVLEEALSMFIMQYYQSRNCPVEIWINYQLSDNARIIQEALWKLHNVKVKILKPTTGSKLLLLNNAYSNAVASLEEFLHNKTKNIEVLKEVQRVFKINKDITRIEVFDNSHIMGTNPVSAMIVATPGGFDKKEYRKYSLSGDTGDDYDLLRQTLNRRLKSLQKNPEKIPDLMIIDGGKGHMSVANAILKDWNLGIPPLNEELEGTRVVSEHGVHIVREHGQSRSLTNQIFGYQRYIPIVCMSKGKDRNAGLEQFHMPNCNSFTLDKTTPIMKYLQILRDEAHNFAIQYHRKKRSKSLTMSSLDNISFIGQKRKKALLQHFGSYEAIMSAKIEDLRRIPGISDSIARKILERS